MVLERKRELDNDGMVFESGNAAAFDPRLSPRYGYGTYMYFVEFNSLTLSVLTIDITKSNFRRKHYDRNLLLLPLSLFI